MKKTRLYAKKTLNGRNYTIIGIDSYTLKNILGKKVTWVSYTLIDNKDCKTWISGPFNGNYYQWSLLEEKEFTSLTKTAVQNNEQTGIANITFEGNPGFSTPYAEILWSDLKNNEFDCIALERFITVDGRKIEPLESYYNAGKILKSITF